MVNFYSQSLKEKEYGIGIDDEISLFIDVDRIKYIYMECQDTSQASWYIKLATEKTKLAKKDNN